MNQTKNKKKIKIVKTLLENKANIKIKDKDKNTFTTFISSKLNIKI